MTSRHRKDWEASYRRKDNFVFYPHEEIIRFISKYYRKRIALHEFLDQSRLPKRPKLLDVGCGIGRHIILAKEYGFDAYGIDLSETAIDVAMRWCEERNFTGMRSKFRQGDMTNLPWKDQYFDVAISHGVLDSVQFVISRAAVKEIWRVLKPGALFYCDLISGDDHTHAREFAGEKLVLTRHEKRTVQLYFNYTRILELLIDAFKIVEVNLIKCENVISGVVSSRYHLTLKKR